MSLAAEFPVCERAAFLNTGSNGPVPRRGGEAAADRSSDVAVEGRQAYPERRQEMRRRQAIAWRRSPRLRARRDLADDLHERGDRDRGGRPGPRRHDRHLDEEHPGVHGRWPRRGSAAPRSSSRPSTTSPMPWTPPPPSSARTSVGSAAARRLAALASVGVPVVYDGAQGIGAVPVDGGRCSMRRLCGLGPKWLCGPDGSGMLYVAPEFRERVPLIPELRDRLRPAAGLDATRWSDSRAWDTPALAGETSRFALASLDPGRCRLGCGPQVAACATSGRVAEERAKRCVLEATRPWSRGTASRRRR